MFAMEEAGEMAARSFERSRRRYRRGIGFTIEGQEKGNFALVKAGELALAAA
jgi:hypothetical protein